MIKTQPLTDTHLFPALEPLDTSTIPTFTELLAEYNASISQSEGTWSHFISNELASPFAVYQTNLAYVQPQPVHWLWQNRLPLAGMTLLDGDHGTGRSLLALQIAACVSSGTKLPDGTPTIQGGVIIITPNVDASTTQLQLLTALGADMSQIEILSFVQEPNPEYPTSGHRPFSLPEDLNHLFNAVERINARLIVVDPFISLLSSQHRWTDQRLGQLLANLNQRLIECNVACLITRSCPARGGHARPSVIERSERFLTIAPSRLLLAHDPMQPDNLLLSHARSTHTALTPTLTLQIQPLPDNPDFPHITFHGSHSLRAKDLIENRPDTLRRRHLSQQLLGLITNATDPIHVSTLYTQLPHSSPFQIQRSLSDLLRTDQIERPARGFYKKAPADPTFVPLDTTPAKTLKQTAAISVATPLDGSLKQTAAISATIPFEDPLKQPAAISAVPPSETKLKQPAAISTAPSSETELNQSAAISAVPPSETELKQPAATSPVPSSEIKLKQPAATSPVPSSETELNQSAATIAATSSETPLNQSAAISDVTSSKISSNRTAIITLKPTAPTTSKLRLSQHKGNNRHKNTKKRH